MTAQIEDRYHYQEKEYTIVAVSSPFPFAPQNYGLEPHPRSTACYRGYWCEYSIVDDELILNTLYLFNRDGYYPPLNGVEVSPKEFMNRDGYIKPSKKKQLSVHFGHRVYKNINLPISYTGKSCLAMILCRNITFTWDFKEDGHTRNSLNLFLMKAYLWNAKT